MSFGKRGTKSENERRAETRRLSPGQTKGGEKADGFKLVKQLLKIAGVFAICYAGYNFILPELLALTIGHPVTGMVPPRSPEGRALRQQAIDRALAGRSPEIRQIEVRLDEACMPTGAQTIHTPLARVEYWVDPEQQWAADVQDPRGQMHIKDVAGYLSCVSRLERQRFCQPYFQAKFASQLERYFDTLRTHNERAEQIASLYRLSRARRPGETNVDGMASEPQSIGLHPSVIATVEDLSRNGYLSAKNFGPFGFGVPKEIASFLLPATQKSCP
ncbi:hypothetical protein [Methylosinus sp. PW1]|uniref:hypothetical protein n=1 Tax=Methylosinus sp. PW1 TaxID=107636 RepID=UPI00055C2F17|nr:hypothetical protein [Methylosinus sp. PW1]